MKWSAVFLVSDRLVGRLVGWIVSPLLQGPVVWVEL